MANGLGSKAKICLENVDYTLLIILILSIVVVVLPAMLVVTMLKHFVGSKKEQFFYHNTLLCLVKALEGKNITMDLRHDTKVCGEVAVVDGFMNITFRTAVFVDAKGNEFAYDQLFVQGRNIRYIHIPENMTAEATIRSELTKSQPKPQKNEEVQKSRKAKKALRLHLETVASLN